MSKQMQLFNETENSISLEDLERYHWPDPDAIVRDLASQADALELFQGVDYLRQWEIVQC